MVEVSLFLSVITLIMNELHSSIKRQCLEEWVKYMIYFLSVTLFSV